MTKLKDIDLEVYKAIKKEEKRHLLSHEETLELLAKAQNGDEEAKEVLISNNLGLVRSVVSKFSNIGYERDDLYQLGSIGLIKAIYKFDPTFNVKFSTYAVPAIMGEIKKFISSFKTKYQNTLIEGRYDPKEFFDIARGLEDLPERSERCYKCYRLRLEETAKIAEKFDFKFFATTLTLSPYKDSKEALRG